MEWESLLLGSEQWAFLLDTAVRTTIMFLLILAGLRLLGKRGIHQLSVFELGVLIGLGSAAGDPMFYKDVGILPAIIVFIIVVSLYRLITWLVSKSESFETFVEGKEAYIIRDGVILETFKKQPIAKNELFAQLRQSHVFHLGQVQSAIIESDGQLSVFFFPDDQVRYGLPILPEALRSSLGVIDNEGVYSCNMCGHTTKLHSGREAVCESCGNNRWSRSSNGLRVR